MSAVISQAIPTNIITGFLGTGKTTAIVQLLKSKPANERWAILVNEFGEIGVDGSLFSGKHSEESGVFIREVPGGCMCCSAALPMQIALNQLLSKAKPDRLIIEPTGLGHPVEVLEVLKSEHYQNILDIQKIVTLVDARKVSDQRYTSHEIFNQQLSIADVIIANKQDLYAPDDKDQLEAYIASLSCPAKAIFYTEQGQIGTDLLEGETAAVGKKQQHHHHTEERMLASEQDLPESGFLQAVNQGEGFNSIGWRFSPDKVFNRGALLGFFACLRVERLKAVFITEAGIFSYNQTLDGLTEQELDECFESRIEIIADQIDSQWQATLLDCQELA